MPDISPQIIRSPVRKPKVILFDLGNTLVTSVADTPHNRLSESLGLTEKQTKKAGRLLMTFHAHKAVELAEALTHILPDKDPARIESVVTSLWDEQESSVREIDGACALLEELKRSDFMLGLISNTWRPHYLGFCLACPEMAGIFDFNLLSFELGIKKPSPQFFERALDVAAAPAPCSLVVGDSFELDIEPARMVGCPGAWILFSTEREKTTITRMLQGIIAPPEIIAENIKNLGDILRDQWP
jgi:FMN phosphatase YigB (HAD superfamily)